MIKKTKLRGVLFLMLSIFCFIPFFYTDAQELPENKSEIIRAKVLEVIDQEKKNIPGTDINSVYQTILIQILEGEQKGKETIIENDYMTLEKGDKFFLHHTTDILNGQDIYSVRDIDRRGAILIFVLLFIGIIIFFSGRQGIRSLISLIVSFFVIIYILIPFLLKGYPPVPISMAIASIILFFAIYFTHGFNRQSTVAFLGTVIAVIFTGILAHLGVEFAKLSGLASEEAVYLNFSTKGMLDFSGLLLGGIMIGILGLLDDIAITQAVVVEEIYNSAPNSSRKEAYRKALRVGKEHVGALVNTLALAYTGASLPLLLLLSTSDSTFSNVISQEIFATEIIRTIIGSIGLILTVPVTTFLAVCFLNNRQTIKKA